MALLALIVALRVYAETDDDTVVRSTAKPRFQVVDGDTVKFCPQLVRLFGIDAPEKGQTCDDGQWHPGPMAKKALEDFIAGRPVTCKQVDYDARNKHRWPSGSRLSQQTFSCSQCGSEAYLAVIAPIKEADIQDYRLDAIERPERHPASVDRLTGRRRGAPVSYSGGELPRRNVNGRR